MLDRVKFVCKYGNKAWKYMLKKLLADEDNSEQKDDATKALIAPAEARRARPQRYQFKLKDSSLCP